MPGAGRRARRWAGALVLAAVPVLVAPPPTAAQSGGVSAQECCLSLLFPVGARAMALGNAIAARPDGGALFANPAALASLDSDEFFVHSLTTSLEKATSFTLLIHSNVAGSFALSYRLVDLGEEQRTDGSGNVTGTLAIFEQVVVATYSTQIVAGLSAGVSYELFQDRQDCRGFCQGADGSATTHGVDVGVQYRPARLPALMVGASLVHFGFPLQVRNQAQADPTPARLRVGGAYDVLRHFRQDSVAEAWVSAEVVASPRNNGELVLNLGGEVIIEETILFWAGHGGGTGLFNGIAVGVGLKYDRFDVGVAKTFASTPLDDEDPFQVTFGIRF